MPLVHHLRTLLTLQREMDENMVSCKTNTRHDLVKLWKNWKNGPGPYPVHGKAQGQALWEKNVLGVFPAQHSPTNAYEGQPTWVCLQPPERWGPCSSPPMRLWWTCFYTSNREQAFQHTTGASGLLCKTVGSLLSAHESLSSFRTK